AARPPAVRGPPRGVRRAARGALPADATAVPTAVGHPDDRRDRDPAALRAPHVPVAVGPRRGAAGAGGDVSAEPRTQSRDGDTTCRARRARARRRVTNHAPAAPTKATARTTASTTFDTSSSLSA